MSNEEIKKLVEALQGEITALKEEVNALKASTTIPYDVEQAFRERFEIDSYASISISSKSATSENKAVNESGSASYSVAKPPDGFMQFTLNNTVYYFPYFT